MAKLKSLRPRVQTLTSRVQVMQPTLGSATPRERGRRWVRRRSAWLYAHPMCCKCEARGLVTEATEVDHVVPLWKGGADDDTNLQSLCTEDHKAKTAAEAGERGAGVNDMVRTPDLPRLRAGAPE